MNEAAPPLPPRRRNKVLRALIVVTLLAGLALVVIFRDRIDYRAIADWANGQPWWAMALEYCALHTFAGIFFIPRLIMGIVAGILFGAIWGSVMSLVGGVCGAFAGFVLVRFVNSDAVRLRETPAVGRWLARAESQGWRLVMIVRLIPVLPHSLVNFVFGLSHVTLGGYLFGSALGMVPTAIVYANLGASGRGIAEGTQDYALLIVWAAGLIFVSWLLPKLIARFFPETGK